MLYATIKDGKNCTLAKTPDFTECYDGIIVGLGTAGAISLIVAAARGMHVLGVEQLNGMGGTGTLGFVNGYYFGARGGFYDEINQLSENVCKEVFCEGGVADAKAMVLEREARRHGAEISYETIVVGTYTENRQIVGLRLFREGKFFDVKGDFIIDASAEAIVARLAGCETRRGRSWDGQTQPATNSCAYIDEKNARHFMNKDFGFARQTETASLGEAILEANELSIYLRSDYSVSKGMLGMAPIFGVREGVTVVGRDTLSFKDIVTCSRQNENDTVFYAFSNVDHHGKDMPFESELLLRWYICAGMWGVLMSVPVTKGALISKDMDNLLTAGRCLSVEHDLASAVRMKSDMEKCGEAAAILMYLAGRDGIRVSDVSCEEVRGILSETHCYDPDNDMRFVLRRNHPITAADRIDFDFTQDEMQKALDSDMAGAALWACFLYPEKWVPCAKEWMHTSHSELLRKNAAIALGLANDKDALPVLRQMLTERDDSIPHYSVKYNYTRASAAIILLGFLGDTESIDDIFSLIESPKMPSAFEPDEFYSNVNDLYSEYAIIAIRALTLIAERVPETQTLIAERLNALVLKRNLSLPITLKANPTCEIDLADEAKRYVQHAFAFSNPMSDNA